MKVISTLPTDKSQTSSLFKELTAEMALKEGAVINEALEFQLFKRERKNTVTLPAVTGK